MSDRAVLQVEIIEQGGEQPASGPARIAPSGSEQPGSAPGGMPESAGERLDRRRRREGDEGSQQVPTSQRRESAAPERPRHDQNTLDILARLSDAAGVPKLGGLLRQGKHLTEIIEQQREQRREREVEFPRPETREKESRAPTVPTGRESQRERPTVPTSAVDDEGVAFDRPQVQPKETKPADVPASERREPKPASVPTSEKREAKPADVPTSQRQDEPERPSPKVVPTADRLAQRIKALEAMQPGEEVGGFKLEEFKSKAIEGRFFTKDGEARTAKQLAMELPDDVKIQGLGKAAAESEPVVAEVVEATKEAARTKPAREAAAKLERPRVDHAPDVPKSQKVPSSGSAPVVPTAGGMRGMIAAAAGPAGAVATAVGMGVAAFRTIDAAQQRAANNLVGVSPDVAMARAMNEAEQIRMRVELSRSVGRKIAEQERAAGRLSRAWEEFSTRAAAEVEGTGALKDIIAMLLGAGSGSLEMRQEGLEKLRKRSPLLANLADAAWEHVVPFSMFKRSRDDFVRWGWMDPPKGEPAHDLLTRAKETPHLKPDGSDIGAATAAPIKGLSFTAQQLRNLGVGLEL